MPIPSELSFWEVTDTVYADRKNIFTFEPAAPYHVGTIISGSRSQLGRFEADVALIRAAPAMQKALGCAVSLLRDDLVCGDAALIELRHLIRRVLVEGQ